MLGKLLQFFINLFIRITGKKIDLQQQPWLSGPCGLQQTIGESYYKQYAEEEGLLFRITTDGGLLEQFYQVLDHNDPLFQKVHPRIKHFYEHTSLYKLEVWSEWYGILSVFAKLLIRSVSSKINQLNIPLSPLATSRGMSSDIIQLINPQTEEVKYACWLRKLSKTNQVVYAGFYSFTKTPALPYPCVKVVFPMPKGNVTVILKVEIQTDGSVKLISDGKRHDGPGYYRTQAVQGNVRYVKKIPLQETIHVFEDEEGVLRTDHIFYFLHIKLLHLHYKIMPK